MTSIEKAVNRLVGKPEAEGTLASSTLLGDAVEVVSSSRSDTSVEQKKPVELDRPLMAANSLLLPEMGGSPLADQFRRIKQPLLRRLDSQSGSNSLSNVVMVTSSLEGEGKTYTSINLAISIAMELDRTALLVDLDMVKKSVVSQLGIVVDPGLSDYLINREVEIASIIHSTDIDRFKLIPAGNAKQIETNAELLTSEKMKAFLLDLSNRYKDRVIVLDTPPLLASSIAKGLAFMAGHLVMVVEAEKTSSTIISESLQYLDGSRFAGFVLNKTNLASSKDSVYGSYG